MKHPIYILGGLLALVLLTALVFLLRLSPAETVPSASVGKDSLDTSTLPSRPDSEPSPGLSGQPDVPARPSGRKPLPLSEAMRWDSDGLAVEQRPDGTAVLHLGGRFTHFSTAVRLESGEQVIQCFSGYTALDGSVSGRPSPVTTPSHHHEPVAF